MWRVLCLLLALPAWAEPFATVDVPADPRITACDYEDTTTAETARVPVVIDTQRGAAPNFRVCKRDIAHWLPGSTHAARMRSVITATGEVSTWLAATLSRPPSAAVVSLALVGEQKNMAENFNGLGAGVDLDTISGWVQRSSGQLAGTGTGQVVGTSAGSDALYEYAGGSYNGVAHYSELITTDGTGAYIGPAVRVTSGGDGWGAICAIAGSFLNLYSGGAYGGESYPFAGAPAGTMVRLSIEDLGGGNSRLKVYYDSVLTLTQDVSTGPASGNPGIAAFSDATSTGDDWNAGNLGGAAAFIARHYYDMIGH